ncbi:SchA/CurD-like domain-containing protein [Actinomadura litoris]|uniref:WhiE I n=1 Tax=Actinomadura litoris TaxID=2678616 RepID=A0A7K1L2I1_9ACTN|nr:SchA/CurD-like domain-containing protein [Actinomadura litoris]MUN38446.1 WhiE I [Actinomadura litoris]
MERHAIMFRIKPGTEEAVKELLAGYAPPEWTAPDGTRLVSTSVFLKDDLVVRMIEIEGNLPGLMAHLSSQPEIQRVEREISQYLAEERDTSTPEGTRDFFINSLMRHVTTRRSEPAQAPA